MLKRLPVNKRWQEMCKIVEVGVSERGSWGGNPGNQVTISPMNARRKKILMLILLAAASAFFLYNGFALLFSEG